MGDRRHIGVLHAHGIGSHQHNRVPKYRRIHGAIQHICHRDHTVAPRFAGIGKIKPIISSVDSREHRFLSPAFLIHLIDLRGETVLPFPLIIQISHRLPHITVRIHKGVGKAAHDCVFQTVIRLYHIIHMIRIVDDPPILTLFRLLLKGKAHGGHDISRFPAGTGKRVIRLPVRLLAVDHIESDHSRAHAVRTV